MLEINDAVVTKPSDNRLKTDADDTPAQTLPGPILNNRTNSYFEPRNVSKWKRLIMKPPMGRLMLNFRPAAGEVK